MFSYKSLPAMYSTVKTAGQPVLLYSVLYSICTKFSGHKYVKH